MNSTDYTLETRQIAAWTAAQEKAISNEYPFDLHGEDMSGYLARVYLQFLWLPEVILYSSVLSESY